MAWVWQECHTILYICVNPWNLWEFFSISTSVNSVESVGVFSINTSVNSVDSVGVFSSLYSVGVLCISPIYENPWNLWEDYAEGVGMARMPYPPKKLL